MKIESKAFPLIHPTTIVVVGTIVNNKSNFTTIGDIAVAGLNPALIMISFNENHFSAKYILKYKKMSINVTDKSMINKVDYAGIHSSKDVDKSNLFKHELVSGLPVINKSPIVLLCCVINSIKVKQRIIFICKIDKTLIEEKHIVNGKVNLEDLEPILYGLDNNYYSGLIKIGEGYKEGLKL